MHCEYWRFHLLGGVYKFFEARDAKRDVFGAVSRLVERVERELRSGLSDRLCGYGADHFSWCYYGAVPPFHQNLHYVLQHGWATSVFGQYSQYVCVHHFVRLDSIEQRCDNGACLFGRRAAVILIFSVDAFARHSDGPFFTESMCQIMFPVVVCLCELRPMSIVRWVLHIVKGTFHHFVTHAVETVFSV